MTGMRKFLVLFVLSALTIIVVFQKKPEEPSPPVMSSVVAKLPNPQAKMNEHDWAKQALDRTREVAGQSVQQKQPENPD